MSEQSHDTRRMQPAEAAWLTSGPAARLLAVLDNDGEEARVVGGAVRNALLGLAAGDIDMATTATPDEVVRRASAAGFKTVPTGADHGTITVVVAGVPFEVTTLREDVETHGRKATVRFGRSWKADAERRDFTINALSVTPDLMIHDYVGGIADIAARRVRFIGDPHKRIAEDYLRILRFFRFHAAYGTGAPDPDGLRACIASRGGLEMLSRERVRMELMKLLVASGASATLSAMEGAGLLVPVLHGVPIVADFGAMATLEAALALEPDPVRRLGALAVLVEEDAERLRHDLRLSNAAFDRLVAMGRHWRRSGPERGERGARERIYRLGPKHFVDCTLLAWVRSTAPTDDAAWRSVATLPERWEAPVFPIRAADLMARQIPKGPLLGAGMRAAEEAWIAAGFPLDQSALQRIIEQAVKAAGAAI